MDNFSIKSSLLIIKGIIVLLGSKIKRNINLVIFREWWKLNNRHNATVPVRVFPKHSVKVGDYTYGPLDVYSWGMTDEHLEIGNFCSIASGVKFILGGNHSLDTFTTFPIGKRILNEKLFTLSKGKIMIEGDVWIGTDATLLSGITIGRGCVIAAGAVVAKSFPAYSIIAGNPGKLVKMRFSDEVLKGLDSVDFKQINLDFIRNNYSDLTKPLSLDVLDQLKRNGLK